VEFLWPSNWLSPATFTGFAADQGANTSFSDTSAQQENVIVSPAAKQPARPHRKGSRAVPRGRRRTPGPARRRQVMLSPADIAEIASTMHMPEGILHLVLSHYPEVGRALARHRKLIA